MENYVYEKSYPTPLKEENPLREAALDVLFPHRHSTPAPGIHAYMISPSFFCILRTLSSDCEEMLRHLSGKIRVTIDYDALTAKVELWSREFNFRQEYMELFNWIARFSKSVCVTSHPSGEAHLSIDMPYFVEISDEDICDHIKPFL